MFFVPMLAMSLSEAKYAIISADVKVSQVAKGSQGSKGFSNELMTLAAFIGSFEKPEQP